MYLFFVIFALFIEYVYSHIVIFLIILKLLLYALFYFIISYRRYNVLSLYGQQILII